MLLSGLLGALSGLSVMAQTNVYSLNAVGYINVTCPPGFTMISCPLMASPDNTIGTLMNNANNTLSGTFVYFFNPSTGGYIVDQAENVNSRGYAGNTNGWLGSPGVLGGSEVLAPGVACWVGNNFSSNIVLTFVGTVPTGPITNALPHGFSLVSSVVPMSGDLVTNSISSLTNYNIGDWVYTWPPGPNGPYTIYQSGSGRGFNGTGYNNNWLAPLGDPAVPTVGSGFWYLNNSAGTVNWVENYSVSQ